jgi:hypothetical protein
MEMNVTSLELCKELYELSGWEPDNWFDTDTADGSPEEYLLTYEDVTVGYGGELRPNTAPAYDLGYLLRKLPVRIAEDVNDIYWLSITPMDRQGTWSLSYEGNREESDDLYFNFGDTPEDAAAKLAIELFKQGILTKEQDNE